jgi:hypothetical protein
MKKGQINFLGQVTKNNATFLELLTEISNGQDIILSLK